MRPDTKGNKFAATYRKSIYIVHHGQSYLECVCDTPRTLRKLVGMMRRKNPTRVYTTDDENNP